MLRHFIDLWDLSPDDACHLIAQSLELKQADRQGKRPGLLSGRTLGLLFDKPSLRTRVSFEAAIDRLGGNSIFLRGEDVGLGIRESVADFSRVLSQYVDGLAVRTFAHSTVEELARQAAIPVINALSHAAHPCQAMADLMTIKELLGSLEGRRLVFVGDGNNVAMSLAIGSALQGAALCSGLAPGIRVPQRFSGTIRHHVSRHPPGRGTRPACAVQGADVDLHRRLGQHGPGARGRRAARGFCPFPGQ